MDFFISFKGRMDGMQFLQIYYLFKKFFLKNRFAFIIKNKFHSQKISVTREMHHSLKKVW